MSLFFFKEPGTIQLALALTTAATEIFLAPIFVIVNTFYYYHISLICHSCITHHNNINKSYIQIAYKFKFCLLHSIKFYSYSQNQSIFYCCNSIYCPMTILLYWTLSTLYISTFPKSIFRWTMRSFTISLLNSLLWYIYFRILDLCI